MAAIPGTWGGANGFNSKDSGDTVSDRSVTQLLQQWRQGDQGALEELTPVVYKQLHALATRIFRRESAGHTLQPTALVNEAMQQLIPADIDWQDRNHFFAISARMMRRILVNHANAKKAAKRGGDARRVTLHDADARQEDGNDIEVLALDRALTELQAFDERKAEIVELHYFAGLSYVELAQVMGIAESTVHSDLRTAKAWLHSKIA